MHHSDLSVLVVMPEQDLSTHQMEGLVEWIESAGDSWGTRPIPNRIEEITDEGSLLDYMDNDKVLRHGLLHATEKRKGLLAQLNKAQEKYTHVPPGPRYSRCFDRVSTTKPDIPEGSSPSWMLPMLFDQWENAIKSWGVNVHRGPKDLPRLRYTLMVLAWRNFVLKNQVNDFRKALKKAKDLYLEILAEAVADANPQEKAIQGEKEKLDAWMYRPHPEWSHYKSPAYSQELPWLNQLSPRSLRAGLYCALLKRREIERQMVCVDAFRWTEGVKFPHAYTAVGPGAPSLPAYDEDEFVIPQDDIDDDTLWRDGVYCYSLEDMMKDSELHKRFLYSIRVVARYNNANWCYLDKCKRAMNIVLNSLAPEEAEHQRKVNVVFLERLMNDS